VRLVEAAGRKAVRCPGDIRDEAMCQRIIDTAVAELGGLDVLVDNAAFQMAQLGGIADITTEQFDRVVKTNLYAMLWLCKKAFRIYCPDRRSSPPPRCRPSIRLRNCWTTPPSRPVSTISPRAWPKNSRRRHPGQRGPTGPIWTPLIPATMPTERAEGHGDSAALGRAG
jgi:NAD(P)-dependent dehydrogenase (short-subunit alcohol dehydrogenase family)